ncbi:MAG: hypothetical protein NDJ90_08970 [Oligoflexia bacterium]|nr:hypothetical protein [Oligoflexia bacterium]
MPLLLLLAALAAAVPMFKGENKEPVQNTQLGEQSAVETRDVLLDRPETPVTPGRASALTLKDTPAEEIMPGLQAGVRKLEAAILAEADTLEPAPVEERLWKAPPPNPCVPRRVGGEAPLSEVNSENLAHAFTGASRMVSCSSPEQAAAEVARQDYRTEFPPGGATEIDYFDGLALQGTPEELALAKNILGEKPPKAWRKAAKKCRDVRCALTAAFGNEEAALRALVIGKRYGYSVSVSQSENGDHESIWRPEQIRKIQNALATMPSTFHGMPHPKAFYLYPRLETRAILDRNKLAMEDVSAFFCGTCGRPGIFFPEDLPVDQFGGEVFVHEMMHGYEASLALDKSELYPEFMKLSGWEEKEEKVEKVENSEAAAPKKVWSHREDAKFMRGYSASNPREDWADSLAAYLVDPQGLRKSASEKYDFAKRFPFGGKEYELWELQHYPGLVEEFQNFGGCATFVRSCQDQLGTFQSDGRTYYEDRDANEGWLLDDFPTRTRCYRKAVRAVTDSMKRGGRCHAESDIEGVLRRACQEPLREFLRSGLRAELKAPTPTRARRP